MINQPSHAMIQKPAYGATTQWSKAAFVMAIATHPTEIDPIKAQSIV